MLNVIVRFAETDYTVEASSIAELYTLVARRFNITNENTIRLIYRGTLLNRADTRLEIPSEAVILMSISIHPPSNPAAQQQPNVGVSHAGLGDSFDLNMGNLIGNIVRGFTNAGAVGQRVDINPTLFATGDTPIVHTFSTTIPNAAAAPPPPTPNAEGNSATTAPVQGVPLATAGLASRGAPAFVSATSFSAPPPIAGVYVHIHCNLDELDEVPQRLARMQAANVPISTRMHATAVPPPNMQPTVVGHGTSSINLAREHLASANLARDHVSTNGTGVPAQEEHTASAYIPRDTSLPPEAGTPEEVNSSSSNAVPTEDERQQPTQIIQLVSQTVASLPGSDLFRLFFGNWDALISAREALRNLVDSHQDAIRSYPEELYNQIFNSNNNNSVAPLDNARNFSEARETLIKWFRETLQAICSCLQSTVPDSEWCSTLRSSLVRLVGGASHYVTNWLGEGHFAMLITPLVQECLENLQQAAFQGMALNYIRSGIPQWEREYFTQIRTESDVVLRFPGRSHDEQDESDGSGFSDLVDSLLEEAGVEAAPVEVREWAESTGNSDVEEPLLQILRTETHPAALNERESTGRAGVWQLYSTQTSGQARN